MGFVEYRYSSYTISDDPSRLDLHAIRDFISGAGGPKNIPIGSVERALANSLSIGVYGSVGNQVGLLRLITDFVTFCFLCDLFVLADHRHQGLSKVMIAMAINHPRLQAVPRWNLIAGDAQELFMRAGFSTIARPDLYMERAVPAGRSTPEVSKVTDKEFCLGYN